MNDIAIWQFDVGISGVLAPGRWLKLRAVLWAALLSVGAFAFFLLSQYLGTWLHLPPNSAYLIVLGIPILAFVVYTWVVRVAERRSPVEVLPNARTIPDLLTGAAIGVIMLSITTAMLWALGLYEIKPNQLKHAFDSFVFDSYLSGMMEELLFRAILLRILARAFGPRWGLALSAVMFGVAHLSHGSWLPILEITIDGGLTLGLIYMVTGRLWIHGEILRQCALQPANSTYHAEDLVALVKVLDSGTDRNDNTRHVQAEHSRQRLPGMATLALADLRVQWVDTTSADLDQDLMTSGLRNRNINFVKRAAWAIYYMCLHGCLP